MHARNAALLALAATADLFSEDDCATKLLPALCPSLVDKEKLVRDQATKTMEIYLQRIRKYQTTLPETLLPPPSSNASGPTAGAPRMGTPAADSSSWAGWAISSFTNKLATASGQMQPVANGSAALGAARPGDQRSSSVPPRPSTDSRPAVNRTLTPAVATTAIPASTRTSTSENPFDADAAADDFGAAWGDEGDDGDDPWGEPVDKPSSAAPAAAAFDDQGEPDFAGWLNAQAAAKQAVKKPLPKGLSKNSPAGLKPAAVRSTSSLGARKPIIGASSGVGAKLPAKKVVEAKKPEPAKQEEDEEGWGDAWE